MKIKLKLRPLQGAEGIQVMTAKANVVITLAPSLVARLTQIENDIATANSTASTALATANAADANAGTALSDAASAAAAAAAAQSTADGAQSWIDSRGTVTLTTCDGSVDVIT